jgi:glycosyltransferase involved in cell wall biosynthesis
MSVYYKAADPLAGATLAAAGAPRKLRAVGLIANLVPYHHARWEAFASTQMAECILLELVGNDEFGVLQYTPSQSLSYSRQILFADAGNNEVSAAETRAKVRQSLSRLKPDVVCLNGYAFTQSLAALQWSIENQVPTVVCSESNEFDAARNPLKEWIKGRLVRLCDSGLAGGASQAQYLNRLGLPGDRIFTGYDAVDNSYFYTQAKAARANEAEIRHRYKLPEHYFLAVSRFTEKKNLSRLIQAYGRYRERAEREGGEASWDLVILGDGPLSQDLCSLRAVLGLDALVHFSGAKPYAEVPAFYGLAEAFIHASTTEQWGLVVNEAMASGLPVLVSNRCGCATDLVEDGGNGFSFDPYDVEQIAGRMLELSRMSAGLRREFAESGRRRVEGFGPGAFAAGMGSAVEVALRRPARKASLADKLMLSFLMNR